MENRNSSGFTLIEMMFVITLLSIFLAFSLPSFKTLYGKYLLESSARQFMSWISYARAGAVTSQCKYKMVLGSLSKDQGSAFTYQLYRELEKNSQKVFVSAQGRWGNKKTCPSAIDVKSSLNEIVFYRNGSTTDGKFIFTSRDGSEVNVDLVGYLGYAKFEQ